MAIDQEEMRNSSFKRDKLSQMASESKTEILYTPVDVDDIQSGTRDAIELKPAKSNEDAFFIIPENSF